jgi:hypothetical protein
VAAATGELELRVASRQGKEDAAVAVVVVEAAELGQPEAVTVEADDLAEPQTIEGFFSLFKNGVGGVYHSVSAKWLQGYLSEYTWRYNRRDNGRAKFLDLLGTAVSRAR